MSSLIPLVKINWGRRSFCICWATCPIRPKGIQTTGRNTLYGYTGWRKQWENMCRVLFPDYLHGLSFWQFNSQDVL